VALANCGTPANPSPSQPPVPEAVADLAARQIGESVALTFTLPRKTTTGDALETPPELEIYRAFLPAGAAVGPQALPKTPLYTVPAALVDTYLSDGRVRFSDVLKPEEMSRRAGEQLLYLVRTRVTKRRASADSNVASLRVYPAPERIRAVQARVTETAVELSWSAPAHTTSGDPIAALVGYRVHRAELEPGAEAVADPAKARLKTPLEFLGVTPSPSYRDMQFEFGHTYLYTVRSVAQQELDSVESADSDAVVVAPRDIFPPAPPGNLVVVPVPATPETPPQLELSWSISPETDLAGYNVYRSGEEGAPPARLNQELLLVPTFRDSSVSPGRRYTYAVTAVDRAGNESAHSAPASAEAPAAGRDNKGNP
jgi:hypothetical protein